MSRLCDKPATHRFTWPGRDESFVCAEHVEKLKATASALGMQLQLVPTHESDQAGETCRQVVK